MTNGTALLEPPALSDSSRLDLSVAERGIPYRLSNVSWEEYERFLTIMGDRSYRSSYADGEFEILMPLPIHAVWVAILGRLIQELAMELDLPIKSLDAVTMRREDTQKGLEPDCCFYLENEPMVRSRLVLNFDVDPPPDLALEAEVTNYVGRRMHIYAALRVPEVWRYGEEGLIVDQLDDTGKYVTVERSRFFPQVPLNELARFVHLYSEMGERELIKSFRVWVRQQIAAEWKGIAP